MAVQTFTFDSAPDISSNAAFRKWATGIHDALLECGWVQTDDTGQADFASMNAPTGTPDTAAGYRVYRLDDALQATAPVFVKFEPGRGGQSSSNVPAAWFTVGQETDGAGNLSRILLPRTITSVGTSVTGVTTEYPSYASGCGSSFCLAMWPMSGTNPIFFFILERSRNASGEPTGEGFLIALSVANNSQNSGTASVSVVRAIGNGGSASSRCADDNFLNVRFPATANGATVDLGTSLSRDGVKAPVLPVPCMAPGLTPWASNVVVAVHPGDAGSTSVIQAATINGKTRIYRAFPAKGATASSAVIAQARGLIEWGNHTCYPAILWGEVE